MNENFSSNFATDIEYITVGTSNAYSKAYESWQYQETGTMFFFKAETFAGTPETDTISLLKVELSSVSDFTSDVSFLDATNAENAFEPSDSSVDKLGTGISQLVIKNATTCKKSNLQEIVKSKKYFRFVFISTAAANKIMLATAFKARDFPVNQ